MNKTALITGASKGIGKDLAELFAANNNNLILVARSEEALSALKEQLENKYKINVLLFIKDLCKIDVAKEIYDQINEREIEVDYLVNNAGFGDYGAFTDTQWDCHQQMIALNITTLTQLTHLFTTDWKGKKKGKILNIASTAAFQPGPMMAVYFATKAFVLSLSEALDEELRDNGITVTTLCPGPTSTNFGEVSKMNASQLVKSVKIANSKDVAKLGFNAMMKGKRTVIHGNMNKLAPFGIRFMPRRLVTKLTAAIMKV